MLEQFVQENQLLLEIKHFYKKEFELGLWTLSLIEEKYNILLAKIADIREIIPIEYFDKKDNSALAEAVACPEYCLDWIKEYVKDKLIYEAFAKPIECKGNLDDMEDIKWLDEN